MRTLWTDQEALQATGHASTQSWEANEIVIDSRHVRPGSMFIALPGQRVNGHEFIEEAYQRGASVVMATESRKTTHPYLQVPDTIEALTQLAKYRRAQAIKTQFFGVTGSVGKTSTKEALALALSAFGEVHATKGNFNNHLGLPITLANLSPDIPFAVCEMGMNHAGEIAFLTKLARPHIAIITNVEAMHLEFFASVAAIADAKAEIFLGVEPKGAVVLNHDNPHYERLVQRAKEAGIEQMISFGNHINATLSLQHATFHQQGIEVTVQIAGKSCTYWLPGEGQHHVMNSLAVLGAIYAAGLDMNLAALSLKQFHVPKGRGAKSTLDYQGKTLRLIDDSYNAGPASMKAALEVFARETSAGRKIAILGDMRELGEENAPGFHKELAPFIEQANLSGVILVGPYMHYLYEMMPSSLRLGYFATVQELLPCIGEYIQDGDTILVKSSLGTGLSKLVETFLQKTSRVCLET